MALTDFKFYADLGAGFVDLTADIAPSSIRTKRGFQSTEPDDLVAGPMTMQWGMNNSLGNSAATVGYYSPDHASVRAGWAVGIPIRLDIICNGNTYTVFRGFLDKIDPTPGIYGDRDVKCYAISFMGVAATANVNSLAAASTKRGDQALTLLLAASQKQPPSTSFATGLDTYPYIFDDLDPKTATVLTGFDAVAKSGLDRIYEKRDGTLVFETRQTREAPSPAVLTITDAGTVSYPTLALIEGGFPVSRSRATLLNQFRLTVKPRRVDAAAVVLHALQISTSPYIEPGTTLTFDGPYVDPNMANQQIGAFNTLISDGGGGSTIGTTGSLPTTDFQLGTTAGGGGSDLSSQMTVTVVFSATKATYTVVSAAAVRAYFGKLQCRGQGIYAYQEVVGTASNTNSQSAIGQTVKSIAMAYQSDPNLAQTLASWCAATFAGDFSQLGGIQVFVPNTDGPTLDQLLQREISDPIAISETVTGINHSYWLDGEELEIDEMANVKVTWPMAPMASTVWALGVVGASELGTTTILAYF